MKKNSTILTFIILLSFYTNSCKGQSIDTLVNTRNKNQILSLKEDYIKALGPDSIRYKKIFFTSFPSNFVTFNSIYGYSDKSGPMPLYSLYEKHISFFCELNSNQSTTEYFNKLIKLGINGHWEADAINALQDCILNHVNEEPTLTITLLKQFKDKEIRSFWRFLFDGPHPDNKNVKRQFDVLYKKLGLIDNIMANLMQDEYLKLVQSSKRQ